MAFSSRKDKVSPVLILLILLAIFLVRGILIAIIAPYKGIGKTPFDYPGTVWRCDEPYIELIIPEKKDQIYVKSEGCYKTSCTVIVDGEKLEIYYIAYEHTNGGYFSKDLYMYRDSVLLHVQCDCNKKELVMAPRNDVTDQLFSGEYESFILYRVK